MICLKNLKEATAQEVYNQVKNHLLTQMKKSSGLGNGAGVCYYRRFDTDTNTTLSCAAGCLIADDEYNSKLEMNTWNELVQDRRVPSAHRFLIMDLQNIHDHFDPVDWRIHLNSIAAQYGLIP